MLNNELCTYVYRISGKEITSMENFPLSIFFATFVICRVCRGLKLKLLLHPLIGHGKIFTYNKILRVRVIFVLVYFVILVLYFSCEQPLSDVFCRNLKFYNANTLELA